jgi:hypothetical protein
VADFLFEEHKGLLVGRANGARYERENPSERDVQIPPAYMITDTDGAVWTFGSEYVVHNGEYEFNVLRNDVDTNETAKRIVYQGGVVTIYGSYGRKRFSRSRRHFI